jgi:regulator of sigma E protease
VGIEWNVDAIVAQQVVSTKSEPFWRAIPLGFADCIQTFVLFKNGIISMVIGATPATLLGPVGVAQLTGEVARSGVSPLLEFAAAFSINLGILNLFPLPALDGGHIFFVFLEWVRRGKRVSPKTENMVHLIGFALLLGLIMFFTYNDIARIISGGSVIP